MSLNIEIRITKVVTWWKSIPGNVKGSCYLLLASFFGAVMGALIKYVGQRINVFEILFIRQLFVLLFVFPVILANLRTVFQTNIFRFHLLRSVFSTIAMTAGFTALIHMPLAEVTAISFVRTLFATLLAIIFFREIVGLRRWITTIVGFLGVLIVVRPDSDNINYYAFLAIFSAFFVACITLILKKLSRVDRPSTIIVYQSIFILIFLLGPAIFLWVHPSILDIIYIAVIGCLMSMLQWLLINAFKVGDVGAIAPMEYTRLIFSTIIGAIFFSEIPSLWTGLGAIIIIGSSFYTVRRNLILRKERGTKDIQQ